ncbi:tetraspanin-19 isoform 5-T5 [Liasis olivaceus]
MKKRRNKLFILKFFLNIFIGVFLVLGLMLLIFPVWISLDRNKFFTLLLSTGEYSLITTVSHVLLVSGSVIIFTGLLGCLGSVQEIRRLVLMHMGFLILIIIIQAAVIVLLYTGKDMINLRWKAKMDQLISNYGNKHLIETEQWNILDVFQRMLHCCGQHNFTDWKVNEHKEHVDQIPCSCTTLNTMKWFCDPVQDAIYTRGCAKDIRIWFSSW